MKNTDFSFENYQLQLENKLSALKQQLRSADIDFPKIEIFASPKKNFRMRCEFRVWHEDDRSDYAMHDPETKQVYTLTDFPIASKAICERMPTLMDAINAEPELRHRLFQVEFLATTKNELLITLIYHRPLESAWERRARELEKELNAHIIGRSRKQKLILSQDYVTEEIQVDDTIYSYQQTENSFTQPNAAICQNMLQWASDQAQEINPNTDKDLLELYCGNGNFSLPLSKQFRLVLATEVSKASVRSAQFNIEDNAIENVQIMRLSSEETVQALNKVREFRRLKEIDLDSYDFSTVFVDPPRAGLDETTIELIKQFEQIIYISCNPTTFINNVQSLDGYTIDSFAAFDQFPYTDHLEIGAILKRI